MTDRSFLGLAVLSIVATTCAPNASLEGLPCPCIEGYRCCSVLPGEQPASAEPICVARASCESRLSVDDASVRQGGTVTVQVMGTAIAGTDVVDAVLRDPSGTVMSGLTGRALPGAEATRIDLTFALPHGLAPGSYTIMFPLRIDATEQSFEAPVEVTFISVGPKGNDANRGTRGAPFATLAQALAVAARGDTVNLEGGAAYGTTEPHPFLSLPDGITLQSDGRMAKIRATLGFARDATVRGVQVTTLDAHVTAPGAQLVFDDVRVDEGGPEGAIVVEKTAPLATIKIQGQSIFKATEVPLVVLRADHATLTVIDRSTLETVGKGDAIGVHGRSVTLNLGDGLARVSIKSWGTHAVLEDGGAAKLNLRGVSLFGFLSVLGEGTDVEVVEADFNASAWEITSGIQFKGAHMFVSDSQFHTMGISQDRALSEVTLRRCRFSYPSWGYHLTAGSLDMGHGKNPGWNDFDAESPAAVALWIDGADGAAAVTSCMTKINGSVPSPFTIEQPNTRDGIYKLEAHDSVVFYEE